MSMTRKTFKLSSANKISIAFILIFSLSCLQLCADSPMKMSAEEASEARTKFIEEAKTHIGKPYVYATVGPNSFDCSGFVYYVAKTSLKLQLPRSSSAIYKTAKKIEDGELEPGDLVFFSASKSKSSVTHVGIFLGNGKFISAVSDGPRTGILISELSEDYWKRTYLCAGRIIASGKTSAQKKAESVNQEEHELKPEPPENDVALNKKSAPKKAGPKKTEQKKPEPPKKTAKNSPKVRITEEDREKINDNLFVIKPKKRPPRKAESDGPDSVCDFCSGNYLCCDSCGG